MTASDPCLEAEELVALHRTEVQRLREARHRLAELRDELDSEVEMRHATSLNTAKDAAQAEYRRAVAEATDAQAIQQAATQWLDDIRRINRAALLAREEDVGLATEVARQETLVRQFEVAVDASRIRAETARDRCNEARRAAAAAAELEDMRAGTARRVSAGPGHEPAITVLLRGDRALLQQVARRLADETELDAGRLQLLLIELCEQIAISALDASAIDFPDDHPFWSHFEPDEARQVALTLARLGYRFDGRGGWLDERVPQPRQLALALAHAGFDSRFRRPLSQAELAELWRGARLEAVSHLAHAAPDLSLEQVQGLLGARAATLDELWDTWPHVRRALLS